jgi:hypothetical protein
VALARPSSTPWTKRPVQRNQTNPKETLDESDRPPKADAFAPCRKFEAGFEVAASPDEVVNWTHGLPAASNDNLGREAVGIAEDTASVT